MNRMPKIIIICAVFSIFIGWTTAAFQNITATDCGATKSCLREPSNCIPGTSCTYFVSWKKVTHNSKQYLEVEIGGTLTSNNDYIAVGFSADTNMGSDGVSTCYHSSGSAVSFLTGHNVLRSYQAITPTADFLITSGTTLGGLYISGSKYLQCRFYRLMSPTESQLKDLNSATYYIFVAKGRMNIGTPQHHYGKLISPKAYNISVVSMESSSTVTSLSKTFKSVSSKSCGRDKSCFSLSDGAFVSWRIQDNMLEIEMSGSVGNAGGYMAFGVSEDATMANDGVIACVSSASGSVAARVAYNPPNTKSNRFVNNYPANFIVTSGVVSGSENLLGGSYTSSGSVVSCRVRRQIKPASNTGELKDLSTPNKYYIMLARASGSSSSGLFKHKSGEGIVTGFAVDLNSNRHVRIGGKSYPLAKAHGCLMILAWMLFIPVGFVFAAFLKPMWPDTTCFGTKVWFQIHRALQLTGMALNIIAFILIFVEIKGYSQVASLPAAAHPVLGIIVVILCITNPIMAIFRCAPDASKRVIFNWAHWAVGYAAYILAIPTIIIGLQLGKSGPVLPTLDYPFGIVIAFAIFVIIVDICFYFGKKWAKKKTTSSTLQLQSKADGGFSNTPGDPNNNDANSEQERLSKINLIILGIFVAGAFIFSLVLIILIGVF